MDPIKSYTIKCVFFWLMLNAAYSDLFICYALKGKLHDSYASSSNYRNGLVALIFLFFILEQL